jgi:hypothetical protein
MGRPSGLSRFSTTYGGTWIQAPLTWTSHPSPTKRASTGLQSATEQHDSALVWGIVNERYHNPNGEPGSAPDGGWPSATWANTDSRNRQPIARNRLKPSAMMRQQARAVPFRRRAPGYRGT